MAFSKLTPGQDRGQDRVVFCPTLEAAQALCSRIDRHMELPNEAMTRWTEPLECEDGTFAVQVPPDVATGMRLGDVHAMKRSIDLRTMHKRTAEELAEATPKEIETPKGDKEANVKRT